MSDVSKAELPKSKQNKTDISINDKTNGSNVSSAYSSVMFTSSDNMKYSKENKVINNESEGSFSRASKINVEKLHNKDDMFGRRSLREPSKRNIRSDIRTPGVFSNNGKNEPTYDVKTESNQSSIIKNLNQVTSSTKTRDIYHHKPIETQLEIVDVSRQSLPASLEKRRGQSSLFEWEANQRQRIEEEEKNKINKNIYIKPVSSKIKDLVKIHTGFMSIFSKDRKREYNGTVDAKEEILFQKIPCEKISKVHINEDLNKPMKSPHIVQTLLNHKLHKDNDVSQRERDHLKITPNNKPKSITPSLEREMYMYNQRNIYVDDSIQRQRLKERETDINKIESIVGKRLKSFEFNENDASRESKMHIEKPQPNLVPSKKGKLDIKLLKNIKDLKNEKEIIQSSYASKELVNNILNNLSSEPSEVINTNHVTAKKNSVNTNESSFCKRSFQESLLKKSDNVSKIYFPKKEFNDNQIVFQKSKAEPTSFNEVDPQSVYKNKPKGRGPVNLSAIIGNTSESSSIISTPLTSPTFNNKNQESFSEFKYNSPTRNQEKENVCPYMDDDDKKITAQTKFENDQNYKNIKSTRTVKNLNERSNHQQNPLSKLVMDWEEKRIKERSDVPGSPPEGSSFQHRSEHTPQSHSFPSRLKLEKSNSLHSTSSLRSTPDREPVSLSSILEGGASLYQSPTRRISSHNDWNETAQNEKQKPEIKKRIKNTNSHVKSNYHYGEVQNNEKKSIHKHSSNYTAKHTLPDHSDSYRSCQRPTKDAGKTYTTSKTVRKQIKESHVYNTPKNKSEKELKPKLKNEESRQSSPTKHNTKETTKPRTKSTRRKNSFNQYLPVDSSTGSSYHKYSKPNKGSEKGTLKSSTKRRDSHRTSEAERSANIKPAGTKWTKTSVRRVKLGNEPPDESVDEGASEQQRKFKSEAARELEQWATGIKVHGKILTKEGQKYSQNLEEEEQEGKKTSKAISRRVVRRGSRRMSNGEMLSETKEMASSGGAALGKSPKDGSSEARRVFQFERSSGAPSRKIKSSTDGERYITQSVTTEGGRHKCTTQGVDNKTTKSVEVIGGKGWVGERAVKGRHGEQLIVEQSLGVGGRPSIVVNKATSQSKLIITKTKNKSANFYH